MVAFPTVKEGSLAHSAGVSAPDASAAGSLGNQLYAMEYIDQYGSARNLVIKTVIPLAADRFAMMTFRGKVLTLFQSQILGWEPVLSIPDDPYPLGWWGTPSGRLRKQN